MPALRKNTLGRNKFFGYQKERIIKCQQVSLMARRWCNIPKTFFIHLCEAPDFDKDQDCWLPRDSVFIPMCNKRYISKPQNKEIGSVSGKTDSLMSFFSAPRFSGWIPIWSVGARHVYLLVPAFKPTQEAQGGAPSDIQVALVAQRRWCKFLVLEFYWYPT